MAKKTVAAFRRKEDKSGLVRIYFPVRTARGTYAFRKEIVNTDRVEEYLARQSKK
ncbi:MAG: DUF4295 family protein [Bacteroidia bacterium]